MLRWSLQLHKWIALVVGLQVLLWTLGGLVMTAIPIERVRSEHHVAKRDLAPLVFDRVISAEAAAKAVGMSPVEAVLKATPRGPVWALKDQAGKVATVAAATGRALPPLSAAEASALAASAYKGEGRPGPSRYLAEAPQETGREGPLWRVDFDDAERTTFYLAPDTGEVVSRRSNVWRVYDFFWRLHIMDLETGEDFNHPLIVTVTGATLVIVLTGFVLLWIRIARDFRGMRARRAALVRP